MISNLDELAATFGSVECISSWDVFRVPSNRTSPREIFAEMETKHELYLMSGSRAATGCFTSSHIACLAVRNEPSLLYATVGSPRLANLLTSNTKVLFAVGY